MDEFRMYNIKQGLIISDRKKNSMFFFICGIYPQNIHVYVNKCTCGYSLT